MGLLMIPGGLAVLIDIYGIIYASCKEGYRDITGAFYLSEVGANRFTASSIISIIGALISFLGYIHYMAHGYHLLPQ